MTPYKGMQSWCRCDWWSLLAVALPVVAQMLLFVLLPGALLADLRQLLFLVKPKTGGKKKEEEELNLILRRLLPLPPYFPPLN